MPLCVCGSNLVCRATSAAENVFLEAHVQEAGTQRRSSGGQLLINWWSIRPLPVSEVPPLFTFALHPAHSAFV